MMATKTMSKPKYKVELITTHKVKALESYRLYNRRNKQRLKAYYSFGEHLEKVKEGLPHGEYGAWLDTVDIPRRTASRATEVIKSAKLADLIEAGSVHRLLQPKTEPAVLEGPTPTPAPIDHDAPEIESQSIVGPVKEQWLYDALALLRPVVKDICGLTVPEKIRISVGPTRSTRIGGFTHMRSASSSDGHIEMVISYEHMTGLSALGTLAHECVHAAGIGNHGKDFSRAGKALGLLGNPTSMCLDGCERAELPEHFRAMLDELGPYPGGVVLPEKPTPEPRDYEHEENLTAAVNLGVPGKFWSANLFGQSPGSIVVNIEALHCEGTGTWSYKIKNIQQKEESEDEIA